MPESSPPKNKRSKSRPTPQQWADIAAKWEMGSTTAQQLADEYNLAHETIYRKMKKMKVVRGAKADAHIEAVQEEMITAARDGAAIAAQRIAETNEIYYKTNEGLHKLVMKEAITTSKAIEAGDIAILEMSAARLKNFKMIADISKTTRQERYVSCGVKEGELSEKELEDLRIEDMTEEDIDDVQRAHEENRTGIPLSELAELAQDGDLDYAAAIEESLKQSG